MDYERTLLILSIISILPCWSIIREWMRMLEDDNGLSIRTALMFPPMMFTVSALMMPWFSLLVHGRILI
jgi:hypothetical protein